jgi:cytochrome c556
MTRSGRIVNGLAIGVMLAVSSAAVLADDQDVIDYRQHIMKTMEEQTAAIEMILQNKAPAEHFAIHVKILAISAAMAKKAFEPKVEGGNTKPQTWTNWPDFSKRLDVLAAATDELAKTAAAGGVAAAGPKVQAALTCKACHDLYLAPKKAP